MAEIAFMAAWLSVHMLIAFSGLTAGWLPPLLAEPPLERHARNQTALVCILSLSEYRSAPVPISIFDPSVQMDSYSSLIGSPGSYSSLLGNIYICR